MKKLGVEMEKNRLQKKTAMVSMNKLEDELKHLEDQELDRQQQAKAKSDMLQSAADVRKALQNRSAQEREAAARAKQKLAGGMPLQKLTKEERNALEHEQKLNKLAQQLEAGDTDAASQTLNDLGAAGFCKISPRSNYNVSPPG